MKEATQYIYVSYFCVGIFLGMVLSWSSMRTPLNYMIYTFHLIDP